VISSESRIIRDDFNNKFRQSKEVSMSFKSVNPASKKFVTPRKWNDWKKDDYVVGTKVECTEVDKFKKPIYALTVKESNFGAPVGQTIYLNNGGNFANMINMVEEGEDCRIEYRGMNVIKKGQWAGQKTHDIDVQIPDATTSDDVL
jgi:hypothetical protein